MPLAGASVLREAESRVGPLDNLTDMPDPILTILVVVADRPAGSVASLPVVGQAGGIEVRRMGTGNIGAGYLIRTAELPAVVSGASLRGAKGLHPAAGRAAAMGRPAVA